MKKVISLVFGPIIGMLKDNDSDKRWSMGRISWILLIVCDLVIWFSGKDVPDGMLTITTYLLLYVTGTKVLGKITDIASLVKNIKELNKGIADVKKSPKTEKKSTGKSKGK